METDIYIREKNGSRELRIPWTPEKITFKANGTRFATYDILDRGEVWIPNGSNIHGYSWEGILPGEKNPATQLLRGGEWLDPKQYQSIWSWWRDNATPLRLLVTGTPINHDVYLDDYTVNYEGAFGDYRYTIEFVDAREFLIQEVPKAEAPSLGKGKKVATAVSAKKVMPTKRTTSKGTGSTSYTIKSGDTLWGIAQKTLGSGSRWREIYNANQEIIEDAAKKRGKKSSSNGNFLVPGVSLTIKK